MTTVTIMRKAVDGLLKWNSEGFASNPEYDKRFIKALLIACIGQRNIAAGNFDNNIIEFIKGL